VVDGVTREGVMANCRIGGVPKAPALSLYMVR
jgi:hypothetical protein